MKPEDLKLKNGMECIHVNEDEKTVGIIVPEGWQISVMATDSGQTLDVEQNGLPRDPSIKLNAVIKPRRIGPKPELVIPEPSGWKSV